MTIRDVIIYFALNLDTDKISV